MSSTKPLDVAIMGFGMRGESFSSYSIDNPDQIRVTAVIDPKPERHERARKVFGPSVSVYDSASDFYAANQPVDGVWVLSRERTHAELAVPVMERGIPIITEKPLATTIADAERIVEAFDSNPVPLAIPHTMRYKPGYRKLKELVISGTLGQVMHIHAAEQIPAMHTVYYYRRGPGMFRENTFFLLAKCSHDIDIINWLMDSPAKSVASFGGTNYFTPRDDVPHRCSDGCLQLDSCTYSPKKVPDQIHELPDFELFIRDTADPNICAWNSPSEQVDHQTVIIQYENGATADFTLRCFGDPRRPIQVTGTDATAYYDQATHELRVVHTKGIYKQSSTGTSEEVFGPDDLPVREGPHGGADWALIDDWVEAVRTGRHTTSATVHEAAEAVVVCVAADTAMREGRVVDVSGLRPPALKNRPSELRQPPIAAGQP